MAVRPQTVGLFVCENLIQDATTRHVSLNILQRRRMRRDPPEPFDLCVFARLVGGRGAVKLALTISRLDTLGEVYRHEITTTFADPVRPVRYVHRLRAWRLPVLGEHEFVLCADEEPIARCKLALYSGGQ
jgi:hypothetical protein